MRRCWPTADTAWSTAGSAGRWRLPSGSRAAHPAAMAPDVTTTTVWPLSRAEATSPHSRATVSSVTDDEPTFTTAIMRGPASLVLAPGEGHGADGDLVPVARAGAGQRAVDAESAQPPDGLGLRARVGEVGQCDGAFGGPAHDQPCPRPGALHVDPLGQRPVHDHLAGPGGQARGRLRPGRPDEHGEPADELVDAGARGRGDDEVA